MAAPVQPLGRVLSSVPMLDTGVAEPLPLRTSQSRYEEFRARSRFGSLDGLRAISIVAVLWHHGPGQHAEWAFLRSGHWGVHLFFAISGFLITTLLLREQAAAGISLRRFYFRRALRIFPLYYTVLVIYVVVVWMGQPNTESGQLFLFNLRYFLTYTANWFVAATATFGFAWSLATEEQFYSVWPWVEKYCNRIMTLSLLAILIAFATALKSGWLGGLLHPGSFPHIVGSSIPLAIGAGVLLAHLLHSPRGYMAADKLIGHPWASAASLIIVLMVIGLSSSEVFIAAVLVLLVASCVIHENHWLQRALQNPVLVQCGAVSYGMYLFHGLMYNIVERMTLRLGWSRHGLLVFTITAVSTLLVASASFRYYESIFLSWKERFRAAR